MKKLLIIILLITFSFGSDIATKDDIRDVKESLTREIKELSREFKSDIKELSREFKSDIKELTSNLKRDMRENNKLLLEVIKSNQENSNKRFEFMQNLMMGLLASIFGAIGYMFWDRKKSLSEAEKKYSEKLDIKLLQKADKKTVEKVITIIEELANRDNSIKEILAKHNLKLEN